jgi:hypothetical protein
MLLERKIRLASWMITPPRFASGRQVGQDDMISQHVCFGESFGTLLALRISDDRAKKKRNRGKGGSGNPDVPCESGSGRAPRYAASDASGSRSAYRTQTRYMRTACLLHSCVCADARASGKSGGSSAGNKGIGAVSDVLGMCECSQLVDALTSPV